MEFVVPICQNYSRTEGFGLCMKIFSGVIMSLAILRVVCLVVVILGFFLESLDATIAADIYVVSTLLMIVLTIIYYSLYFLLLKKAKDKCTNGYLEDIGNQIPKPEEIGATRAGSEKKLKSLNWAPPVFLAFFVLESILLFYFAIVVNSFGGRESGD